MEEDKKMQRGKIVRNIIVLVIVFYIGYLNGSYTKDDHASIQPTSATDNTSISPKHVPEGMYRAGKDIPPGEYRLTNNNQGKYDAYFSVTTDSTGSSGSRVSSDSISNQYFVTIKDGEYIKLERCYMEKLDNPT